MQSLACFIVSISRSAGERPTLANGPVIMAPSREAVVLGRISTILDGRSPEAALDPQEFSPMLSLAEENQVARPH